ncbi:MAG: DUF3298 domain-containing protein [Candidatus Pacebacteria bacterium]|jgi:hypothetical protein|nr:DUF3298 domain-containing protein [Candidatus Paceibacterota bacterium]MBP9852346.1 DUF3298 domain-containing protein [Candidatus Paceibacterota bacterium]
MSNTAKIIVVILLVAVVGGYAFRRASRPEPTNEQPIIQEPVVVEEAFSITKKEIKEDNFSGTMPEIKGKSALAASARAYVEKTVADFRERANLEVPDLRKEFGDLPPAHYTIEIEATHFSGSTTESILLNEYIYTGGANGMSLYTAFTVEKATDTILSLKDVIILEKQKAFADLVKKRLLAAGKAGTLSIFPEDVNKLSFESFTDFAFDDTSLILYFDKYAIAPGASGPIAYKIPTADLKADLSIQ